jgi:DNA-binding transcriptional LysR family regulator
MEIRYLKTLSKIAELGSFTKAAQLLGYAQSTLTFQIQTIEAYYNRPVFEKLGKALQLTPFGRLLVEQANSVLNEYELLQQLGRDDVRPQGCLRIGAAESLMVYRLYPLIKAYKSAYPQVEISLVNRPCEMLREDLPAGRLDVSFLLQPDISYPDLNIRLLREERMCLVAPVGHAREDYLPEPTQMVLYTEKECTYRQEYESYLKKLMFEAKNVLETSNVEAIKKYVINGLGVSYLPYYSVREEAENGLLSVKFPLSGLRFFTQAAYHKKKWLSPALQALLDLSAEYGAKWSEEEKLPRRGSLLNPV